ncbi:Uncharacterised protein [Mycobacteroides abscessus subsp. abscessus]|nr:Uncharacterised protein [Mycobacteroides abscessus subsp. abscessus]
MYTCHHATHVLGIEDPDVPDRPLGDLLLQDVVGQKFLGRRLIRRIGKRRFGIALGQCLQVSLYRGLGGRRAAGGPRLAVAATGKRHDSHHNGHHQQHHTGSHPGDNQCLAVLLRRGRWLPKLLILLRLTAELVGPTGLLGRLNKVRRRAVGIWLRRAHGCRAPELRAVVLRRGVGRSVNGIGAAELRRRLRHARAPSSR